MKRPFRGTRADWLRAGVTGNERVLLTIRPSCWVIVTEHWRVLALLLLALVLDRIFVPDELAGFRLGFFVAVLLLLLLGIRLLVSALQWAVRVHVVTQTRVILVAGVVRRIIAEAPLGRVQQITVIKLASERAVGIGSVLIETAGSHVGGIVIAGVPRPERVAAIVRAAARRQPKGELGVGESKPSNQSGPSRVKHHSGVLILGLAGGIGAGKSAVAAAMGKMGCVVVDSDKESKAALDRPDVKRQLTQWWGEGVLDSFGAVDRRKIAEIVFANPAQRHRLESLIHPIVRQTRAEMVQRAAAAGTPVVIVDAPLLFEAGVDKECDAVVFVDAPPDVRVERVRRTRGWDKAELDRREAAQLSIQDKLRRSRYVILNDASPDRLEPRIREILTRAMADFGVGPLP